MRRVGEPGGKRGAFIRAGASDRTFTVDIILVLFCCIVCSLQILVQFGNIILLIYSDEGFYSVAKID